MKFSNFFKTIAKYAVVSDKGRGYHYLGDLNGFLKQEGQAEIPAQELKRWKEMASRLGAKDFTAFLRGAVLAAIHKSRQSKDPKWQEFVEAIQPIARRVLGHGFFDGGGKLYGDSGAESSGVPAKEFLTKMKKKHGAA
jgi:hypothetical protein